MAKFAELPDGTRLEFPDNAPDEVMNRVVRQHLTQQQRVDPTEGMSVGEKLLAGAGKAFVDIGRGAGQILGMVSDKDISEARRLDAPLMQTGAGTTGNIVGNVAAAIPTAFIPGAATIPGGAAIGAGLGMLQPTTQEESRVVNAITGAIAGGAVPSVVSGARAAKSAIYDPLAGQNRILGGAITRSVGPDKAKQVAKALRGQGAMTPGVRLSSAEISQNEALAAMEDALRSSIPGGQLSTQSQANRSVLANALRGIGQDDTALQAAISSRDEAADALYGRAFDIDASRREIAKDILGQKAYVSAGGIHQQIPSAEMSLREDLATPVIRELASRPMFKDAVSLAKQLALNKGIKIGDPLQSLQGLHYVKLALDDMTNPNAASAMGRNATAAAMDMKTKLFDEIAKIAPLYGAAKSSYSEMSRPINQMEVGQRLANTLIPATAGDIPSSLNYASLARAMRNPDVVAQQATGFGGARMAGIMSPEQMQTIQGVTSDTSRIAESLRRGVGVGSPTARRFATSDFISQHFAENAPISSWLIEKAGNVPGVGMVTKGFGAAGGMVGSKLNQNMASSLDEMLATNPQQVANLIEKELSRLSAPERNQLIKMLPQSVMLSLPSINSN